MEEKYFVKLCNHIHIVIYIGAKARRLKMDNQDGTASIPALTREAEHLSTLATLKEIREQWAHRNGTAGSSIAPLTGGLFGGLTKVRAVPTVPATKRRACTPATYDLYLLREMSITLALIVVKRCH